MATHPGKHTIYYREEQVKWFEENPAHGIQRFTKYAVDNQIEEEEMKRKGYVKKFVKEGGE